MNLIKKLIMINLISDAYFLFYESEHCMVPFSYWIFNHLLFSISLYRNHFQNIRIYHNRFGNYCLFFISNSFINQFFIGNLNPIDNLTVSYIEVI